MKGNVTKTDWVTPCPFGARHQAFQKRNELLAGVPSGSHAVHLASLHIQSRVQRECAVLDGTFEIRIGDQVHAVGPGGFAYGPRGTRHNFRNTAETPSRILLGFTPGGIEDFFRESGQPATDDGPAPPVNEDEIARMMAAAPKYGIEGVADD